MTEETSTKTKKDFKKLSGYEFYEKCLNSARYVVAPMVDASELSWRLLARNYGAQLCYTPMWHSRVFIRDSKYRAECFQNSPKDRPLIAQFCANDPEIFKKAIELTLKAEKDHGFVCDAIDLNLGCPQVIARRGHFGSFLQDEWELLQKMVSLVHETCDIPITVKLRVFDDEAKSVEYAKMLEKAGAQLLTVHGRTREQKGALTGLASWSHIKAIKRAVKVPVFANGNIQNMDDVHKCIEETGVDGVMSAETQLHNPALFAGINPPCWQMAEEYLDLCEKHPTPISFVRGHMFKIFHFLLQIRTNFEIRELVAKGQALPTFRHATAFLKEKYLPFYEGKETWETPEELKQYKMVHPPWLCQPYERPPPEEHLKKMEFIRKRDLEAKEKEESSPKKIHYDKDGNEISRKKFKKMERNPHKDWSHAHVRENIKVCQACPNPCGLKCPIGLCKKCCWKKCFTEELDCEGHRIWVKTKRERARARDAAAGKEIQEIPSAKELQDMPSDKEIKECPSAKEIEECPSSKEIQDCPSAMEIQECPTAKEIKEMPSAAES